jgi:hypothetical protein
MGYMIHVLIVGLTIETCVVRLNVSLLHFAILDDKSIAFAARTTEDSSSTIKREVQGLGEFKLWISDEADLRFDMLLSASIV